MEKIVVANLKMNLSSLSERKSYIEIFRKEIKNKKTENVQTVICPAFVHLEAFEKIKTKKVFLGAQNIFWEKKGSFTGEISAEMVKNLGVDFVILGHSERRRFLHENDEEINFKVRMALKTGLTPIICVGDKEQREESEDFFMKQLENCLEEVNSAKMENVVVCYEPVWAISSNNPDHMPTTNEVMSARLVIKKILVEKYSKKIADKVRIIYGGSVDSKNVEDVCIKSGMDGALVGRESLTPHEFVKIIEKLNL